MNDLYQVFSNLRSFRGDNKIVQVEEIFPGLHHKIGCSEEGYPMIFVYCCDDIPTTPIKLKLFAVNFNQICKLQESNREPETRKYTIIQLKSLESDFQKYFIDVMSIVLRKLPPTPTVKELKSEVGKVISLFTASPSFSKEVVKGLWAELFVIAHGNNPSYLAQSWHVSPEDKYDFNDGIDKIEVKSTSKTERVHTFAIEQLNPNVGSELAIASVITIISGQGINIFDLLDVIAQLIPSQELFLKVQEIVYTTIGPHIEEVKKLRIDQNMALNTYAIYDYKEVPAINIKDVPTKVTSVHFSSCLKDCMTLDVSALSSQLLNSL